MIEKDYTIRHKKEIEMYQKIQKNNLKNKNLMVPASVFQNNSEQILSNINNSINSNSSNNTNKNKTFDNNKEIINDENNNNNKNNNNNSTIDFEAKLDRGKIKTNGNNNQVYKNEDN